MKREDLILKWLDHNLNAEEQKAFEQLEDYDKLIKMDKALSKFEAPDFNADTNFNALKTSLKTNPSAKTHWYKPLLKIAAILAVGFSVYYYTLTLDTSLNTAIAEQSSVVLPDESTVELNSNSSLIFNKHNWEDKRMVTLNGEAFFKVAKGQKFDVETETGVVSVLGTEFNVKHRKNYFEVICYEGIVAVKSDLKTEELRAGDVFKIIDGKYIANEKESNLQPTWLTGESSFKDVPLSYVIAEFENQYGLKIQLDNIDTTRRYTGSFTHKNLDLALQSITIPLNLTYSKSKNSIVLKRE